MADINPKDLVKNFQEYSEDGSIGGAFRSAAGGILAALGIAVIAFIDVWQSLFTDPISAIIDGSVGVLNGLIGGTARILIQGATTAVQSLAPGATWAIGPLTFLMAIVLMGAAMYIFAQILQVPATSDMIPFSSTDVPFLGAEEENG